MHDSQVNSLLSEATKHVQIADHLLTVTYKMAKDPKLLLSVMEHTKHGIEKTAQALALAEGKYHGTDDPVEAFSSTTYGKKDAEIITLHNSLEVTLKKFKEAPMAFRKEQRFIIADEGFSSIKEVTPEELKHAMQTLKRFVHDAHKAVVGL